MKIVEKIEEFVEQKWFQTVVLAAIGINAFVFALQTSPSLVASYGTVFNWVDHLCLAVFTVELGLKMFAYQKKFCSDWWNVFDFLVVGISFVPDCGVFSALRVFRVLRVFKVISGVRQMRVILDAIFRSIPGIAWSASVMLLIYFVYGILGTNLYSQTFPEWFGTLPRTACSLFQIMTLESWAMGIARPVAAVHPWAWLYFISYILISTFTIMNVVVGIILNSIAESSRQTLHFKIKRHGLIIGWGFQGVPAVMAMFEVWGMKEVVVYTEKPIEEVRAELENELGPKAVRKVFIYSGTLGNPENLDALYPERARIIVVLGSGSKENNDGGNLRIGKILRRKIGAEFAAHPPAPDAEPIKLFLDISCPYNLSTAEMFPAEGIVVPKGMEVHIINFYKSTVRELFSSFSQFVDWNTGRRNGVYETAYLPLAFRGMDDTTHVHLVVAGIGNMAKTLVLELAPLMATGKAPGVITVFSSDEKEIDRFASAYPFEKLQGVEIEFVASDIDSRASRARLAEIVRDESASVTLFITESRADEALAMVNRLPDEVRMENVRLLIDQRILAKWAHNVNPLRLRGFHYADFFGFTDRYFTSLAERYSLAAKTLAGEKASSTRARFFMESIVDGLLENLQFHGYSFEYNPEGRREPVLVLPDDEMDSFCKFEYLRAVNFSLLRGGEPDSDCSGVFHDVDEFVPWESVSPAQKEKYRVRIEKALKTLGELYNCGEFPYIVERRRFRRVVGALPVEDLEESIGERRAVRKAVILPEIAASKLRSPEGKVKSEKSVALVMSPGTGLSRILYQLAFLHSIPMILVLPCPREEFLARFHLRERAQFERWLRNADRIVVAEKSVEKTIRSLATSIIVRKDGGWGLEKP